MKHTYYKEKRRSFSSYY